MSFKGYDKQTFIVDSAKAFGQRRISKREFLKRMGLAGIGFSGFAAGLLGNTRMRGRGLIGSPASAADTGKPGASNRTSSVSRAPRNDRSSCR